MKPSVERFAIFNGQSYEDVLRRIGSDDWDFVKHTVSTTHSVNTGNLFHAMVVFRLQGSWYPAKVWDAEIGGRFVLVYWNEKIEAGNAQVAILLWREYKNKIQLEVRRELVAENPQNKVFKENLEDAERESLELDAIRQSLN